MLLNRFCAPPGSRIQREALFPLINQRFPSAAPVDCRWCLAERALKTEGDRTNGGIAVACLAMSDNKTRTPGAQPNENERSQSELERLAAENAALDRRNRMRAEMVETISHEVRTPLAVLASYSSLVAMEMREKNAAPQSADLDKIAFEAKRIASLIDQMRNLPLQKEKAEQRTKLDMGKLVAQTTDLYRHILKRRGISLVTSIPDNPPSALGCPEELTQVVFNLMQNAKKHSEAGGSISVKLESGNGELQVVIADTGAGVGADILPRVFERGVHDGSGGTGIGLAVCREIVEAHGGNIRMESEPGRGTTVTFTLPADAPEPESV